MIKIFSLGTGVVQFSIRTPKKTFDITHQTYECEYQLFAEEVPLGIYDSPYDAICAVAQHKTNFLAWDSSEEKVSDYAGDWARHLDDCFKIQLLSDFIEKRPNETYRWLVDYVETKHPYLMDRCEVADLLDDLYFTGQSHTLLSTFMAPSEFAGRIKKWKEWLANPLSA